MAGLTGEHRERIDAIWAAVRSMIEPEYRRYLTLYPAGRRFPILEALRDAAEREDELALASAGLEYLRLTRIIPPGCYGIHKKAGGADYHLSGERIRGRLEPELWTICRYSPQVWR